jgi:hypothetical protein
LVSSVNNSGASPYINSSSPSLNLTVTGLSSTSPVVTLAAAPPNGTKMMLSVCCYGQSVCLSSPQLLVVPQDCTGMSYIPQVPSASMGPLPPFPPNIFLPPPTPPSYPPSGVLNLSLTFYN